MKLFGYSGLIVLLSLFSPLASSAEPPNPDAVNYDAERLAFWEAKQALEDGNLRVYQQLLEQLQDYPLLGYLRYEYLRTRLDKSPDSEIQDFLARYGDSPIGVRLHEARLNMLAGAGRWDTYLQEYPKHPPGNTVLQCYALEASLRTSGSETPSSEWLDEVQGLWLVGKSLPAQCDPLFKILRRNGRLTSELVWQRIRLAMDNRQLSLAQSLASDLDKQDRAWVTRWQRMHKDPEQMLEHPDLTGDGPKAREIVLYGMKRLARDDAQAAASQWERLKDAYPFSEAEQAAAQREIALRAALQRQPEALEWLAALQPAQLDDTVRQWRIKAALAKQDWNTALNWIEALPNEERDKEQWRYWRARALEQGAATKAPNDAPQGSGAPEISAEQIYSELASQRSYYGFLAADRLGRSYEITHKPTPMTETEFRDFMSRPGMVRARELYELGMITEARREWDYFVAAADSRQRQLAAVVAHRWGWHDRAIIASAKANYFDDLEVRFPVLFRDQVLASAETQGLDPAWIYGVMRQESAFSVDARSSAGALGLMQLMPATGKHTAQLLNTPLRGTSELLDADKNIQLGSAYLRQVLDENSSDVIRATASYNAGPQRVKQWLPSASMPADIWVENVPFTETRNYIQQVMTYATIFYQRLGREIVPLKKRMQDISPE